MPFLRRISTRRLLALCVAVVAVAAGGTALAIAASSGGPVPARQPLANAIHGALAAPQPQGVSARIAFTNNLLDGVDLRGSNPVLSGATGRLWATADGRFRLELQSSGGDAQIVSDGASWWAYDGSSNTVYRGTVPKDRGHERMHRGNVPTVGRIQRVLDQVMRHAAIAGPTPVNIAGQPAYDVRVSPKRYGGLLGSLEYAWDASHGVPLRAAVYARGQSSPVLELTATDVSFGPVPASTFAIPAPSARTTQRINPPQRGARHRGAHAAPVTGLARVQRRAGFAISAPATLAGRTRQEVALVGHGRAALVTYGRGLDGIAVIERRATAESQRGPLAHAQLPTVSIGGVTAQELSTPLGTVLRFERAGVRYVVLASAPHAVVEAAARGL